MATQQTTGEKKPLREKVLTYYDLILKGQDPSGKKIQFWDEFFLLKSNVEYLSQKVRVLSVQELVALKKSFNLLFRKCVTVLQVDDNNIRNINALQTLCVLMRAVFMKKTGDIVFDVIDVLVGIDSAECQMRNLGESLNKFLAEDYPVSLKNLALRLLLVLVTATDNISTNVFLEYLMMNSVFESLMQILSVPEMRDHHGYDGVVVVTMLINYRKYEAANPYVIKLSVLDDEIALNGFGCVISSVLTEYNRQYSAPIEQPVGFLGQLTSLVSNMLVPSESPQAAVQINEAVLLALYQAVYLNRTFITILTHTRSPSQPPTPTAPAPAVDRSLPVPTPPATPDGGKSLLPKQPTNLLGTFLTFSSILLQNTKDERSVFQARLCLIILMCITEDQFANAFLHDPNMTFPVTLHRASLLHRKVKVERSLQCVPLASSLLDLMVEFMLSHLSRNFRIELYSKSLGIVHRILCYQKRCKVRLAYNWKELWSALVNILKFFISSEDHLLPKYNIFKVADEIAKIFNLFITYGDTFLPNPTTYDELYYELVRMHKVFDDLFAMAQRHTTPGSELRESAQRLSSNLVNICSITAHFRPKVDAWMATHQVASITPEQVLEVVRSNYDTLTLKLQDNLDHFEKYAEKPKEMAFFTQLVRSVAAEIRDSITLSSLQQMSVLTELAAIS